MHRNRGVAALAAAAGLVGAALWGLEMLAQQPDADRAAVRRSLPRAEDLPSGFSPVSALARHGTFYAAGGQAAFRIDDGNHYHGYDGPAVWAKEPKGLRPQGVLYGFEEEAVTSAGYLVRQADLTDAGGQPLSVPLALPSAAGSGRGRAPARRSPAALGPAPAIYRVRL